MPDIDHATFTDHSELLARTADEMQRQLKRWGRQSHPLCHRDSPRDFYAVGAQHWKNENDLRAVDGEQSWDAILLEEVYEAFAEGDVSNVVEELVQSAAVCLSAAYSVLHYGIDGKRP